MTHPAGLTPAREEHIRESVERWGLDPEVAERWIEQERVRPPRPEEPEPLDPSDSLFLLGLLARREQSAALAALGRKRREVMLAVLHQLAQGRAIAEAKKAAAKRRGVTADAVDRLFSDLRKAAAEAA